MPLDRRHRNFWIFLYSLHVQKSGHGSGKTGSSVDALSSPSERAWIPIYDMGVYLRSSCSRCVGSPTNSSDFLGGIFCTDFFFPRLKTRSADSSVYIKSRAAYTFWANARRHWTALRTGVAYEVPKYDHQFSPNFDSICCGWETSGVTRIRTKYFTNEGRPN